MRSGKQLCWRLLYTKPRAEVWVELNLRRQGYETLLPRVKGRAGYGGPRYLFVGVAPEQSDRSIRSTRGVHYVVCCGEQPVRVPGEVVDEPRRRMDAHGVVGLDETVRPDHLFARRKRERVRALTKLAEARFRVRAA